MNRKKVLIFVTLTYFVSYLLAISYFLAGGTMMFPGIFLVCVAYMFVPAASAMFVQKVIYKSPVIRPLRISFRLNPWFFVAWLLPVLVAFATLGVSLLFPGVTFSPDNGSFGTLFVEPQQLGMP